MRKLKVALMAGALALVANATLAAGLYTNGVPPAGGTQYPSTLPLTGNETLPADTNLGQGINPASESVSVNQLNSAVAGNPTAGNALIGGDATTNLWQRATAGAATTSATPAYSGPDRWGQASLSSASVTLSRDSTAADLVPGYQYAFKLAHSNTTAGQICMMQVVESVNSYQFAGSVAELDFHAVTGAGFTPAAPYNMNAYIVYGTGADEGLSKMAYTINSSYGSSPGWAGGVVASAGLTPLGGVSTAGRYSVVASIPATATEIGVALCYTAGTTTTNDYIAFSGIQLKRSPWLASYASATIGYNDTTFPASSFERRSQAVETVLQQRYYYQVTEPAASIGVGCTGGDYVSTTTMLITCPLPVAMRIAPTLTFGGTLSGTTWAIICQSATPVVLGTPYMVQSTLGANTTQAMTLKVTSTCVLGSAVTLVGAGGGSSINASSEE